jgi:hypothetical protein
VSQILRFVEIPAGRVIVDASRVELGDFDESNRREQYKLRQIRVGLQKPNNGIKYTAMLAVPGGVSIGPIDIPFRFNVELPCNLSFSSDAAFAEPQIILCTAHDLPDSPDLYGATYFVPDAPAATPVEIWPWVHSVTIYDGATATFYSAASVAIATAVGPQMVARPRAAKYISSTGSERSNPILYHY